MCEEHHGQDQSGILTQENWHLAWQAATHASVCGFIIMAVTKVGMVLHASLRGTHAAFSREGYNCSARVPLNGWLYHIEKREARNDLIVLCYIF